MSIRNIKVLKQSDKMMKIPNTDCAKKKYFYSGCRGVGRNANNDLKKNMFKCFRRKTGSFT